MTPLSRKILSDLLRAIDTSKTPLVIDADAINLLSRNRSLLKYSKGAVLTPHFMEASRLIDRPIEELLPHTNDTAREIAIRCDAVAVMKDHNTAVSDGSSRVYVNKSGNSGMATAGSGDVLSGVIGAFLAGGMETAMAASYGVFVHGLAGDKVFIKTGSCGMMASDIIKGLKEIWNKVD